MISIQALILTSLGFYYSKITKYYRLKNKFFRLNKC